MDFEKGHLRIEHRTHFLDGFKRLLAREVVADVAVVDAGRGFLQLRFIRSYANAPLGRNVSGAIGLVGVDLLPIPDQQRDGDGRAGTGTENLAALLSRQLTARSLIAAEVEDIDGIELLLQRLAEAVHRARVEPSGVGDERDNSLAAFKSVRRPAERLYVAVVECVLVRRLRLRSIRPRNRRLELRIRLVLRVVVGAFLSDGIRRIADDDADGRSALAADAV